MGIEDSNARWRTFLQEQYQQEIQVLASGWPNSKILPVAFSVLQAMSPDFAQILIEYPKPILRAGTEALRAICREGGHEIDPMLRIIELPIDSWLATDLNCQGTLQHFITPRELPPASD